MGKKRNQCNFSCNNQNFAQRILSSRKMLGTASNIAVPKVHFVNLAGVCFFCNSKVKIIQFYTLTLLPICTLLCVSAIE